MPLVRNSARAPGPRLPPGTALLGLSTLITAASLALATPVAHAIYCERLAPLAVLGALAATLVALGFRGLSNAASVTVSPAQRTRSVLFAALLLAALSLFVCARFLARYHGACSEVEQRLHQLKSRT